VDFKILIIENVKGGTDTSLQVFKHTDFLTKLGCFTYNEAFEDVARAFSNHEIGAIVNNIKLNIGALNL
jgi:hypothetical protein